MGFFDRFKSRVEKIGKDKKPKHVVARKQKADEEKHRLFASVPSAGPEVAKKREQRPVEKTTAKVESKKPEKQRREDTGEAYRILLRPVVSEKATLVASKNQYVFVVSKRANKIAVRRAVESLYGVRPQKVNILNVSGKLVRYGRSRGETQDWKKAIVTLQPGQKIDVS